MKKFCPKCGVPVQGTTFCEACRPDKPIEEESVSICPTSQYRYDGSWRQYSNPDDVIDYVVSQACPGATVKAVSHNIDRLRHRNGESFDVEITVVDDGTTRSIPLHVDVTESPRRKRQHASYKAATVQVRNVRDKVEVFLHDKLSSLPSDSSLNMIEETRHGIDIMFGETSEAERFVKDVAGELGGTWDSSRSLHTVDSTTSKDVYRSTYVLRVFPFDESDVIRSEDVLLHVQRCGEDIYGFDVRAATAKSVPSSSLMDAEPRPKTKVTVSSVQPSLHVLHPDTYQSVRARNPYEYDVVPGQTVTVIVDEEEVFVVND